MKSNSVQALCELLRRYEKTDSPLTDQINGLIDTILDHTLKVHPCCFAALWLLLHSVICMDKVSCPRFRTPVFSFSSIVVGHRCCGRVRRWALRWSTPRYAA